MRSLNLIYAIGQVYRYFSFIFKKFESSLRFRAAMITRWYLLLRQEYSASRDASRATASPVFPPPSITYSPGKFLGQPPLPGPDICFSLWLARPQSIWWFSRLHLTVTFSPFLIGRTYIHCAGLSLCCCFLLSRREFSCLSISRFILSAPHSLDILFIIFLMPPLKMLLSGRGIGAFLQRPIAMHVLRRSAIISTWLTHREWLWAKSYIAYCSARPTFFSFHAASPPPHWYIIYFTLAILLLFAFSPQLASA